MADNFETDFGEVPPAEVPASPLEAEDDFGQGEGGFFGTDEAPASNTFFEGDNKGSATDAFFAGAEASASDDLFGAVPEPLVQDTPAPDVGAAMDAGGFGAAIPLGDEFAAEDHPASELTTESFAMPPEEEKENPKVAEMREAMRLRLREVDEREATKKAELTSAAKEYLETHHKNRADATERRKKNNRESESLSGGQAPSGDTYWERIVEYIDFSAPTKSGVDMSRYKNVLFAAKAKNVPVHVA